MAAIVLGLVISWILGNHHRRDSSTTPAATGRSTEESEFVGSATCAECHERESVLWSGSDHAHAMHTASTSTVLADPGTHDLPVMGPGARLSLSKDALLFAPTGRESVPVVYTLGVYPLQQLLIEMPKGRIQALTVAWDVGKAEWYSLYPEILAPADSLHYSQPSQNFSSMCADCHTTAFRKNFDLQQNSYASQWAEMGVGCEACHGAGRSHVTWARQWKGYGEEKDPLLAVRVKDLDSEGLMNTCAPCHSLRRPLTPAYVHEGSFYDSYQPALLDAGQYAADGQIEAEVYEYGSFLQSKMFSRGVKCTDCHNAHSGKLAADGDALCVRCHTESPPAKFDSLKSKSYRSQDHHKHPREDVPVQCVDCHMAERTYMGIDNRRDHSFRIPRPAGTIQFGSPNACNRCHSDQSAQWAQAAIERLWGRHTDRYDFGRVFAEARQGVGSSSPELVALLANREQPPIVRATAIRLLASLSPVNFLSILEREARDSHPLVRFSATQALSAVTPEGDELRRKARILDALFRDPTRLVRAEAGRVAGELQPSLFNGGDEANLKNARAEFLLRERANDDRPDAHVTLGIDAEHRGDVSLARAEYEQALSLSNTFAPAHMNLAVLLARNGDRRAAETHIRSAVAIEPESGRSHYALALLLNEQGKVAEAITAAEKATKLMPNEARPFFTLGLLLDRHGDSSRAIEALKRAGRLAPEDPDILYALAHFYAQRKQRSEALAWLGRLQTKSPGDPRARALANSLKP